MHKISNVSRQSNSSGSTDVHEGPGTHLVAGLLYVFKKDIVYGQQHIMLNTGVSYCIALEVIFE